MGTIFKILLAALVTLGALLYLIGARDSSILIESAESKTPDGRPIFNRIRLLSLGDKDVWMMNQTHQGLNLPEAGWSRIAIVVDKTKSPKRARFVQIAPGPLEWSEAAPREEFTISCYLCHTNGPRAIRPRLDSTHARLSLVDKVRIWLWNTRIKSYGRVVYDPIHDEEDKRAKVPFRFHGKMENEKLTVGACARCHKDSGLFARGPLSRQNGRTIEHMLSQRHMPPLWLSLSDADRNAISDFANGN